MDSRMDFSKKIETSEVPQAPQSSQISQTPSISIDSEAPKMVQLAMKLFKVERKKAEYALFGFVVLMIAFSLFLFFSSGDTSTFNLDDYPFGIVPPEAT